MAILKGFLKKLAGALRRSEHRIQEQGIYEAVKEPVSTSNLSEKTEEARKLLAAPSVEPDLARPTQSDSGQAQTHREPYFIQVGLDFGTSYCKCVWRDVSVDRAWVYLPSAPADPEHPFLIPSALQVVDGALCVGDSSAHYHENGLPHVKIALVKVAIKEWTDPSLVPFRAILGAKHIDRLDSFVAACAVYLLSGVIGAVRNAVRQHYGDFGVHPEDYIGVSLAIPVADAERQEINNLFHRVLEAAVEHADELADHPKIPLVQVSKLVPQRMTASQATDDAHDYRCFIYPEVSAGVQGFVRSGVAEKGIYFFSETGAATVDQSVFIFWRPSEGEKLLTYLHASVLPLGSSQIEQTAAEICGDTRPIELDRWRKLKEDDNRSSPLLVARRTIGERLAVGTFHTLGVARRKLPSKRQFEDIRVLFGGGGDARNPYQNCVLQVFDNINLHGRPFEPDVVGMPSPRDLEPASAIQRWMNRLWIAYGLSFWPGDFPNHRYPKDIPPAQPVRAREIPLAVSKDEC